MAHNTDTDRALRPRGYSRQFTPAAGSRPGRYLLANIPAGLWRRAQAKARRDGVSMRFVLLRFLESWVGDERAALTDAEVLEALEFVRRVATEAVEVGRARLEKGGAL